MGARHDFGRSAFPRLRRHRTRISISAVAAVAVGGCGSSGTSQSAAGGGLPPPRFGRSLDIGLVSGTVVVTLPNKRSFTLGAQDRNIPIGSLLDTTRGRVDLRAATPPKTGSTAPLQDAQFYQGAFTVSQTTPGQATRVSLAGGRFATCPSPSAGGTASVPTRAVRLLRASGAGTFATEGRYAAATVRGTVWLTEDFCSGTLVQVTQGVVSVKNLVTHATVTVTAGHSLFVRAQ